MNGKKRFLVFHNRAVTKQLEKSSRFKFFLLPIECRKMPGPVGEFQRVASFVPQKPVSALDSSTSSTLTSIPDHVPSFKLGNFLF